MEGLNQFFNNFAPMIIMLLTALTFVLVVWVFLLQFRTEQVLRHYRALMKGASGENLETALAQLLQRVDQTGARVDNLTDLCQRLEVAFSRSVQRVGLVRYNPFPDMGGDQSFAIALLDANGDGIVLSSLYGRSEMRVYAKAIKKGLSSYPLSAEEKQALQQAQMTV